MDNIDRLWIWVLNVHHLFDDVFHCVQIMIFVYTQWLRSMFVEKYIPFITLVISAISIAIIVLVTSKIQSLEIQFSVLTNEVNQYKNSLNHLYEINNFHDDEQQQIEPAPIDQPYVDDIEQMKPIVQQPQLDETMTAQPKEQDT